MNSTIFKQTSSKWASLAYPTKASSFGGNGCGCCACTHVAIEQSAKRNWTPNNLRSWMIKQGYAVVNQGTTWSGIYATLAYIGHKNIVWVKRSDPMSKAWTELNKGNRIGVLLVDNSRTPDGTKWTASGHYVAFVNYKYENGKHWFYIKDSGSRNHDGWFCYEKSIKGALPQLWIVQRIITKGDKIAVKGWAYAYHSNSVNAKYPSGHAKTAYKNALDSIWGKTRKWHASAKVGASCDVFVATCIRASGVDKTVPRGMGRSKLSSSKWTKVSSPTVSNVRDGDIISIEWSNGNPHWAMVYNGKVLEASLNGFYPKYQNNLKSRLSKSGKKSVIVYRAK